MVWAPSSHIFSSHFLSIPTVSSSQLLQQLQCYQNHLTFFLQALHLIVLASVHCPQQNLSNIDVSLSHVYLWIILCRQRFVMKIFQYKLLLCILFPSFMQIIHTLLPSYTNLLLGHTLVQLRFQLLHYEQAGPEQHQIMPTNALKLEHKKSLSIIPNLFKHWHRSSNSLILIFISCPYGSFILSHHYSW